MRNFTNIKLSFSFEDFVFREKGGKEKEKERHMDQWGPDPEPRHVPRLEIKPATFLFTGQRSVH